MFAVDNIVFILATNRSALAHSVRSVYGSDLDAEGYLRRFFDIDFRLPEPERDKFIQTLFDAAQITDYFKEHVRREEDAVMRELFVKALGLSHVSLRDVTQAIRRFMLVLGSLPDQHHPSVAMATLVVMLRTANPDLYYRFIQHEVSDAETVQSISSLLYPETDVLHYNQTPIAFEALVIVAAHDNLDRAQQSPASLFAEYSQFAPGKALEHGSLAPKARHAIPVSERVRSYEYDWADIRRAFEHAVQCLELVSQYFNEG